MIIEHCLVIGYLIIGYFHIMSNFIKFSLILLLLLNIFSFGILKINAASLINDPNDDNASLNANSACMKNGDCKLNDILSIVLNVSSFILGIVGSLALFALTAGGLMWIFSAGNPEWVTRGKQTVIGAVVGLAVVFTSFMIIQLVFMALGIEGVKDAPNPIGAWATSGWLKK